MEDNASDVGSDQELLIKKLFSGEYPFFSGLPVSKFCHKLSAKPKQKEKNCSCVKFI